MQMKDQRNALNEEEYTLNVLRMAVNATLDESILDTVEGLASLESNRDQLVWEIATKIYTHSGHKIELPMVRDLIDARIEKLKRSLVREEERYFDREFVSEKLPQATQPVPEISSTREIFLKICAVICECTQVSANRVSMGSQICNLSDKREVSKIMMQLEQTFNIKIPDQAAREITTIKQAVTFVNSRLGDRPHVSQASDPFTLLMR